MQPLALLAGSKAVEEIESRRMLVRTVFASPLAICPFICMCVLLVVFTGCFQAKYDEVTALADQMPDQGRLVGSPTQTATLAEKSQATSETGDDWVSFLGPHGDGTSSETGIDPQNWTPHPPLLWTKKLGTSYGSPAIIGNKLLQFDRFGSKERLTCFDTRTAEELWRQESLVEYDDMYGYNNGPRCTPIVSDGRIYTYGVAGNLCCVELSTGNLLWSKDLVEEFDVIQNFFGVASTPCLYNDLLLVMVGGSPPESSQLPPGNLDLVKPNGTAILAFNKVTGEEVYRLGDDLASYSSLSVQNINGQDTGLAFLRSGLLAWDPASGKERFRFPWRASMLESVNAALPVVSENKILLSETYEIGSCLLDLESGDPKVVWQDEGRLSRHSFRAHWSTPVVIDGYLYGCSGRNQPDSDFRCVRLSDGKVMWFDRRHERSSVLSVDGHLIVLGEYGQLDLVKPNPEKLEVVAEVDLSDLADPQDGGPLLQYPCWAAPVLSHGRLYLRGKERLICLDIFAKTGTGDEN